MYKEYKILIVVVTSFIIIEYLKSTFLSLFTTKIKTLVKDTVRDSFIWLIGKILEFTEVGLSEEEKVKNKIKSGVIIYCI